MRLVNRALYKNDRLYQIQPPKAPGPQTQENTSPVGGCCSGLALSAGRGAPLLITWVLLEGGGHRDTQRRCDTEHDKKGMLLSLSTRPSSQIPNISIMKTGQG